MKDVTNIAGRANERKRIIDSITNRDIRSIIVYGPRYIGKSQILQSLAGEWQLDSQLHTLYVDVAEEANVPGDGTLNQLGTLAVSTLQAAGIEVGDLSVRGDDIEFWQSLCKQLGDDQKLLIILDSLCPHADLAQISAQLPEHQYPNFVNHEANKATANELLDSNGLGNHPLPEDDDPKDITGDANQDAPCGDEDGIATQGNSTEEDSTEEDSTAIEFYQFLPRLLQCKQIKLILGADIIAPEPMSRYFLEHAHQLRMIQVNPLSKDDTEKVLHNEGIEELVSWKSSSAIERVWSLTNGHPAFVSAVSSAVSDEVFQDIGELERAKRINADVIDGVLPKVMDMITPVASWYWTSLSKEEKLILTIIAYMDPGIVSADTIALALNDIQLSQLVWGISDERFDLDKQLTQIDLSQILVKFQGMHLVDQTSNLYSIPIRLMREWIVENHELPEDYSRLVRKASMQEVGYQPETLVGGVIKYIPKPDAGLGRSSSPGLFGRKTAIAAIVLLLIGALLSLPFLARTFGFEEFTTFIPEWMLPTENVLIADAAPPSKQIPLVMESEAQANRAAEPAGESSADALQQDTMSSASDSNQQRSLTESGASLANATQAQDDVEAAPVNARPQTATFALVQELSLDDMVWTVAFNSDEQRIAAGLQSGDIAVWDIKQVGEPQVLSALEGHSREVLTIAFNPVQKSLLASASADSIIRIWDIDTGEILRSLEGHSDEIATLAYNFDGSILASGSADSTIRLWDAESGDVIATLGGENEWVLALAFSPDGTRLASGTIDGTIQIWDVANLTRLDTLEAHKDWVSSLAYSSNGVLASTSYDENVYIWDIPKRLASPPTEAAQGKPTGTVNSIAFHPDGRYLIGGQHDGSLLVWDLMKPEEPSTLTGHMDAVRSAVFSPKGRYIATGALDGKVRLWQVDVE